MAKGRAGSGILHGKKRAATEQGLYILVNCMTSTERGSQAANENENVRKKTADSSAAANMGAFLQRRSKEVRKGVSQEEFRANSTAIVHCPCRLDFSCQDRPSGSIILPSHCQSKMYGTHAVPVHALHHSADRPPMHVSSSGICKDVY